MILGENLILLINSLRRVVLWKAARNEFVWIFLKIFDLEVETSEV